MPSRPAHRTAWNTGFATTAVNTAAKVQAIVNAYNLILAEANGALTDLTPGQDPTAATYSVMSATTAASPRARP